MLGQDRSQAAVKQVCSGEAYNLWGERWPYQLPYMQGKEVYRNYILCFALGMAIHAQELASHSSRGCLPPPPHPPHTALNNLKWDNWEPWWSVFVLFKLSKKLMSHRKYFSLVPLAGSNHLQQLLNRLPNFKYIWQKNRDLKGIMLQIQHTAKLGIPPSP